MITINLMDILTTLSKTKIIMISLFKKMSNNSSVALHSLKKKDFTPNFHEEQITLLIFFLMQQSSLFPLCHRIFL